MTGSRRATGRHLLVVVLTLWSAVGVAAQARTSPVLMLEGDIQRIAGSKGDVVLVAFTRQSDAPYAARERVIADIARAVRAVHRYELP